MDLSLYLPFYKFVYNNNVCRLFEKPLLTVLEARVLENFRYADTRKDRTDGWGGGTYFGTLRQLDKGDDNYYSTLWMDGNSEKDGRWAPRVEVHDIYRPVRFSYRRSRIVGTYNIIESH